LHAGAAFFATRVIAPSPLEGEGNSELQRRRMGEG
jgi:hypothetical protein